MPIRTLVVDDTITYRKLISDVLSSLPSIEIIGTAANGSIALKKLSQNKADLVFLDVHMPEMDGIETLKKIRSEFPSIIVVMMSGISTRNTSDTIEALQNGAIDFIRKPDGSNLKSNMQQLKNDISLVMRLVEVRLTSSNTQSRLSEKSTHKFQSPADVFTSAKKASPALISFSVCVVGVSTGGPEALSKFIPMLPKDFTLPVLLVQHMPPLFTKSLAESLGRKSNLVVTEAEEDELISPGKVYIAPGGKHMVVRTRDGKRVIGLNDEPPENSCRPSVDVLFRSVATQFENQNVLAVILTGMGNDGCSGVRTLKRKSCYCITQSQDSCIVYGMPRAVDEAGLSDLSLPIEKIAPEIVTLCGKPGQRIKTCI